MTELAICAMLFLLPCAVILERCISDWSLLALHPALNSLAMLICLPSALQAMLQRKSETNQKKRIWLTKLHLLLNVLAGVLVAVAGVAVLFAKRNVGDQHLTTPHSWAALVTGMFFALNMFQGILLTFEGTKANWQWKDETHVLTGVLVYIGSVTTMLYGLQTSSWGAKHFSLERQFQVTILIIAAHVTLLGKMLWPQRRDSPSQVIKVAKLELIVLSGLFGAPCAIILSKCAASPSLFAVHPATNAVAFLLCFPLGLYVMLERKSVTNFRTRVLLSKLHMFFQVLAMLLLSTGGVAAYMTKNKFGKQHFTSTHSWLAIGTAVLAMLNMLGGLVTTFGSKKTSWQWKNSGHRIGGTLAFLGGGCSVILGIYSGSWGISQLGENLQFQVASSIAAAYFLLFFKVVTSGSVAKKSD
ncbi:unnamed protein product [Peronospora farinosa]|uniref:Cytochrome b561 domain-containing protein n=1 Tax=Peronospora farinosa TaxID=134698 RepID=A0AAV0TZT3_9STRA|nr:unnamed protein product [Peronospora farinosa]CAI5727811.1 unnamed protein product [Peronospora farinosa]